MPAYNSTIGDPMGMFKNSTKETKEFEKIILEIEKERDTISGLIQPFKVVYGTLKIQRPIVLPLIGV